MKRVTTNEETNRVSYRMLTLQVALTAFSDFDTAYNFSKFLEEFTPCLIFLMAAPQISSQLSHSCLFDTTVCYRGSRGSSVSIVSNYGLDDRAIVVRSPTGAKDFSSSLGVQTGSGANPASCPFPRAKRRRGVTLTTHSHLVPRSKMSRSHISSPPKRHHGV
jgi:hypothetical protein